MDKETPYNPSNALITREVIAAMLKEHGVVDGVEDMGQYYKSMVHRSYCTRKNETFAAGNKQCPESCLPLQEESNERLELLGIRRFAVSPLRRRAHAELLFAVAPASTRRIAR